MIIAAWTSTELPSGYGNNDSVLDCRVLDQDRLDVLWKHVLATGQDYHVFDPTLDAQEALFIKETEIAGLVPTIFECLRRHIGSVVVAGGDVLSL